MYITGSKSVIIFYVWSIFNLHYLNFDSRIDKMQFESGTPKYQTSNTNNNTQIIIIDEYDKYHHGIDRNEFETKL